MRAKLYPGPHKTVCVRWSVTRQLQWMFFGRVIARSDTDVHTVASLLKLYLRELPEPVVPWTQYEDFLDCTNTLDSSTTEVPFYFIRNKKKSMKKSSCDKYEWVCPLISRSGLGKVGATDRTSPQNQLQPSQLCLPVSGRTDTSSRPSGQRHHAGLRSVWPCIR